MSFSAFVTKLLTGQNRAEKISILASETDEISGIIPNVTTVTKSYMESTGPSGDTGTALAGLLDVYELLTGLQSSTALDINGMIDFTTNGIAILSGSATTGQLAIGSEVGVTALFSTATVATGTFAVTGNTVIASDLTMSKNDGTAHLHLGKNALTIYDTIVGQSNIDVFRMGTNGDVRLGHNLNGLDCYNETPHAFFGKMITGALTWWLGGEHRLNSDIKDIPLAMVDLDGNISHGLMNTAKMAGRPWDGTTLATMAQMGGANHRLVSVDSSGDNILTFQGGFDPADADDNNGDSVFSIWHDFGGGTDSLTIKSLTSGYSICNFLRLSMTGGVQRADFTAAQGTGWAQLIMRVRSADDFDVIICPQSPAINNRIVDGDGGSNPTFMDPEDYMVPSVRMTNGVGGGNHSYGRLGFDSWSDRAAFRLWIDDLNSTTDGIVAIGPPAGTYANPIDRLAWIPGAGSIGVNIDHLWLLANHSTKSGLWVGKGGDTYAGRAYLQDSTGYRASIMMGDVQEPYYMFLKDGALRTIVNSATVSNIGNSGALGAHLVPVLETNEVLDSGHLADVITEVENTVGSGIGSAILVSTSDSTTRWLMISDGTKWSYWAATGRET